MPEIEIRGKKIKIPYTKKGKKLAVKLKKKKKKISSSYGDSFVSTDGGGGEGGPGAGG